MDPAVACDWDEAMREAAKDVSQLGSDGVAPPPWPPDPMATSALHPYGLRISTMPGDAPNQLQRGLRDTRQGGVKGHSSGGHHSRSHAMSDTSQVDWNHIAAVVTQHWEQTNHWVSYEELVGSPLPEGGGETSPPPTPVTLDLPSGVPISLEVIAEALLFFPTILGAIGGFDSPTLTPPLQETPVHIPADEASIITRLTCLDDFA
jgi:hypothetical protein